MNIKKIISLLLVFSSLSLSAKDVIGEKNARFFVKVTGNKDEVTFEKCEVRRPDLCTGIGKQPYYTLSELRNQRSEEAKDVYYSLGLDIVLVAAAVGTGSWLLFGAASADTGLIVGLPAVTLGLPITGAVVLGGLNPIEQSAQRDTLEETVITDKLVRVKNIKKFIGRLETVLDNIEE
jgi:hypothetical protein